jgi:phosphoglycolate phosphatase-like HAD superfamily hydrolase
MKRPLLTAMFALMSTATGCAVRCIAADTVGHRVDPAVLEAGLTLWPEADRRALASAAAAAATGQNSPYAVFDADGTIWSSDATESFIAYLEANGLLTPERLRPEIKVIPFLPGEGVYSYYQRLCKIDKAIGYPFSAQVFAGLSLAELRGHYAGMMKTPGSTVRVWKTGSFADEFVPTPKLFPQQTQLIHALEKSGVKVYIVTASPEELVRFLASDPACGEGFNLHLPPERVIGVNLLLRDDKTGEIFSSRLRLRNAAALFDTENTR